MSSSNTAIESSTFFLQERNNLGAVEIGTFIGLILYGANMAQGYHYFTKNGADPLYLKIMVSVLMLFETSHTFIAAQEVYLATITDWAKEEANSYPISITIVLECIITAMVQSFFAYRIHRISRRVLAPAFFLFVIAVRFIAAIAISALSLLDVPKTPNGLDMHTDRTLITFALVMGAVADLLIAVTLSYDLRKMSTEFTTDRVAGAVNRLIRWSLQTGIITCCASIAVATTFATMSNLVFVGLYIVLAKLYSISFLIALNVRQLNRPMTIHEFKEQGNISSNTAHEQRLGLNTPTVMVTLHTSSDSGSFK